MCFYRENQTSFKGNLRAKNSIRPIRLQTQSSKQPEAISTLNDHYAVKKHELDKVVPGLFDELFKLGSLPSKSSEEQNQAIAEEFRRSADEMQSRNTVEQHHQTGLYEGAKTQPFNGNANGLNLQLSSMMMMSNQIQMDQVLRENIFKMLTANTILLNQLSDEIDKNATKVVSCFEHTTSLRNDIKDTKISTEQPKNPLCKIQETPASGKATNYNPSSIQLFQHLCGSYNKFPYELVLDNEIPHPIFRERNIKFKISLIHAIDRKPVLDHSKIVLQITLHTWQIPSNIITRNKIGNRVIQGEIECELRNGEAIFDKLQINEVTSKFINGSVAILISPKRPNNYGTSLDVLEKEKESMTCDDIKPLMIDKVVVKSKKKKYLMKKKKNEKNL